VISAEFGARTAQAALYCLLARKKLVIWATLSEQSERGRGKPRRLLRHLLLALADRVLVNGESGARYLRSFGLKDERIQRVPQSTEMSALLALPLGRTPVETKRLVYLGRLIELKGLEGFIAQLSAWCDHHPDQHIELQLVGDGPLRKQLESMPRAANLRLVFRGEVAYAQLPQVLREAGILVFPTLSDEWGLVVVEAMAAGLPVLGSLYGQAVEELVRNGENGWTFRPDHADELDRAFDSALLCGDSDLMRMRMRARETVRGLTPESMVERVLRALADKS
jgi:glycosyltransferase involved in cell wall biosynthesis